MVQGVRLTAISVALLASIAQGSETQAPQTDSRATVVQPESLNDLFRPGPQYDNQFYDADAQLEIYGGKTAFDPPRAFEMFRPIYTEGPFKPGADALGVDNLIFPAVAIYGDLRTAVAYNDNGTDHESQIATRLNVDIDVKLTGTERIHAFIRPLDDGANFTRHRFSGSQANDSDTIFDPELETLFFEGDWGALMAGWTGETSSYDLPFAFGLIPLTFQNGIWMDDAITGFAISSTAKNSKTLDISNYDVTFFAGFDRITSAALSNDNDADLYGLAFFADANQGHWEGGIARVNGKDALAGLDYTSAGLAFTKRYLDRVSNSFRVISSFGQKPPSGVEQTADGTMILIENSLVTSSPSTYVPYANFFIGFDKPQPLADETGLLKNTGISFETDGLTGFPKLDDTGEDVYGGALGVQYLFNLDQQVVLEVATVIPRDTNRVGAVAEQSALSARYQKPVAKDWIVRLDAIYAEREALEDVGGVRAELRFKF